MFYQFFFANKVITVFVHHEESIELHSISSIDLEVFSQVFLDVRFYLFITNIASFVSIKMLKPFVYDSFDKFILILCRLNRLS